MWIINTDIYSYKIKVYVDIDKNIEGGDLFICLSKFL